MKATLETVTGVTINRDIDISASCQARPLCAARC